jgi:hypothetical protein
VAVALGAVILATAGAQVYPVRLDGQQVEPAAPTPPSLVLADGGLQFPDGTVQMTATIGRALVPDTGQTTCWESNGMPPVGSPRPCAGTGEDGEFQAGVAWPTPRFTDNGDGTVTDNLTGLIWLKDADCPAVEKTWQQALDWVVDLNTTSIACIDYAPMTFADWRLPNIRELLSLVDYSQAVGAALPLGHPFLGGVKQFYWSSSSLVTLESYAWIVDMFIGNGDYRAKTEIHFVWPVRGGEIAAGGQDASLVLNDGGIQYPDGSVQTTASAGRALVPDTGQFECWDTAGNPRPCAGTGEDGEFQAGVDWPTPRFTDNGDGTVTDNLTGLIWLKDANCPAGFKEWQDALNWVASLNTTSIACADYTAGTFTDWRLPNIRELWSLVEHSHVAPALPLDHPFLNVQASQAGQPSSYWSSSSLVPLDPGAAWYVDMFFGNDNVFFKNTFYYVWPVRGGQ